VQRAFSSSHAGCVNTDCNTGFAACQDDPRSSLVMSVERALSRQSATAVENQQLVNILSSTKNGACASGTV
jgi:hypothetical protein